MLSVDEKGWTPMHYACDKGSFDVIASLVDIGLAFFDIKDSNGKTPLDIAVARGHLDTVYEIIQEIELGQKMKALGLNNSLSDEYEIPYELQGYDLSNDDGYYWTGREGFDSDDQYYRFIDSLYNPHDYDY